MEYLTLILCVLPSITSISVSPNGNSPQVKMIGGMAVDVQKGFVPMTAAIETTTNSNYEKSRKINNDVSNLALNERYRRLIPYMTFYYANNLAKPTTDIATNIEVEKAEIVEANSSETTQRQPKKIVYSSYREIPRYQGNRLTQYNIASANPTKIFYNNGVPIYEGPSYTTPYKNPLLYEPRHNDPRRYVHKPPFQFRKPLINPFNKESPNIRYYHQQKEPAPKYKLVPYEQTPPVEVQRENENTYEARKPVLVSVLVPKELYVKPRTVRPPYVHQVGNQHTWKQPSIVSETYYEKQRPRVVTIEPSVESGFKPIATPPEYTTVLPIYKTTVAEAPISHYDVENISPPPIRPEAAVKPDYFQYVVDDTTPTQTKPLKQTRLQSNSISLASILNSLQAHKSIPKPITKDNVASSINTLLEVLNAMKSSKFSTADFVMRTPKPFGSSKIVGEDNLQPETTDIKKPELHNAELLEDYLEAVIPPSQHLDDHSSFKGTSQRFPQQVVSNDDGSIPGQPGLDYPIHATIPPSKFDCKAQRYKGFFADIETRCQVWHYCDLNGGQASFLCPNGTIFSQATLTCDWWFNVQCSSTTQLYVLNESLYKYILPHSPKFPEDYSGPLVDKYLTLKFKEMEEQFKKNRIKGPAEDTEDEEDEEDKKESTESSRGEVDKRQLNDLSVASVIIESPGYSGKVERLIDD